MFDASACRGHRVSTTSRQRVGLLTNKRTHIVSGPTRYRGGTDSVTTK